MPDEFNIEPEFEGDDEFFDRVLRDKPDGTKKNTSGSSERAATGNPVIDDVPGVEAADLFTGKKVPKEGAKAAGSGGALNTLKGISSKIAIPLAIAGTVSRVTSAVTKPIGQGGSFGNSIANRDTTGALREGAQVARSIYSPFGLNPAAEIVVAGFDALLQINQGILDSVKQDQAFAPQTLAASIEGQLNTLVQRISIAQRLDPLTAELVKVNNQLDLAFGELRAELIQTVAPLLIEMIPVVIKLLPPIAEAMDILVFIIRNHPTTAILDLILAKMPDPDLGENVENSQIFQQISDFFRPAKVDVPIPNP